MELDRHVIRGSETTIFWRGFNSIEVRWLGIIEGSTKCVPTRIVNETFVVAADDLEWPFVARHEGRDMTVQLNKNMRACG